MPSRFTAGTSVPPQLNSGMPVTGGSEGAGTRQLLAATSCDRCSVLMR